MRAGIGLASGRDLAVRGDVAEGMLLLELLEERNQRAVLRRFERRLSLSSTKGISAGCSAQRCPRRMHSDGR